MSKEVKDKILVEVEVGKKLFESCRTIIPNMSAEEIKLAVEDIVLGLLFMMRSEKVLDLKRSFVQLIKE